MKRIWFVICSLCLLLSCAACGSTADSDGKLRLTVDGIAVEMHGEAEPVLEALGQPLSCTEEASCAFEGMDKTYSYPGFYLQTYPKEGKEYLSALWFTDDTHKTFEGIGIGSTLEEAQQVYGEDAYNGINALLVETGDAKLVLRVEDNLISGVQLQAILR